MVKSYRCRPRRGVALVWMDVFRCSRCRISPSAPFMCSRQDARPPRRTVGRVDALARGSRARSVGSGGPGEMGWMDGWMEHYGRSSSYLCSVIGRWRRMTAPFSKMPFGMIWGWRGDAWEGGRGFCFCAVDGIAIECCTVCLPVQNYHAVESRLSY